jgi:hypothetical protein
MGGSHSCQEHGGGDYSGRLGRRLGQPLWGAGGYYLRPRHTVHVGGLGGAVQPATDPAHHHHCLPPLQQRHGGEVPPPAEGRAAARSGANDWPDHLPWVLLGLRAAPKRPTFFEELVN